MTLAFCDTETVGLDLIKHGICQIGGYATGEEFEAKRGSFCLDANPGTEIEQSALDVNGFTRERIEAAQPIGTVIHMFDAWLESLDDPHLVFHNAPFDVPRLQLAYERAGVSTKRLRRVLCTVSIEFSVSGTVSSLAALCEKYGIRNESAHDALGDATATARAFHAIMKSKVAA